MLPLDLIEAARLVVAELESAHLMLATAESCTGGLISTAITAIPGASNVLERGFVTYSNDAKAELIGVPLSLIAAHGAVSEAVARAMAEGALTFSRAHVAVAVTGIAGPSGGTPGKPVGLVHMAAALRGHPTLHLRKVFPGSRDQIRHAAAVAALDLTLRQARG